MLRIVSHTSPISKIPLPHWEHPNISRLRIEPDSHWQVDEQSVWRAVSHTSPISKIPLPHNEHADKATFHTRFSKH